MAATLSDRPDWDRLYETAVAQEGMFSTRQAAAAGYSPQLLKHHMRGGRVMRVRRSVYRLVHFPAGEHEELVAVWLWSEQAGVFSYETALALHALSDVLPARIRLALPSAWRRRRFRVPDGVVLHYADVPSEDRTWHGAVPITSVGRTLNDCAREGLAPELLRQAVHQSLRRGLVARRQLADVEDALRPFGGLAA